MTTLQTATGQADPGPTEPVAAVDRAVPAAFVRGGTSKGLVFRAEVLPPARNDWAPIFLSALGSPDPYGRQLNGMGGGLSSLSKVCVVAPSSRADADVEYTFAQVQIGDARVDYSGNCGNMSAAIGPYAVDEGLTAPAGDGPTSVRLFNTNTGKVIVARFDVHRGRSLISPMTRLEGVQGPATQVELDYLEPAGAATGRLLPTGAVIDRIELPDGRLVTVSMIDAANPCVFVPAGEVGLAGTESPAELADNPRLLTNLAAIREAASVAMGLAPDAAAARLNRMTPLIALTAPPAPYRASDGADIGADEMDVSVRFLSNGQPHKAVPGTGVICAAVAAAVPGSVVQRARPGATFAAGRLRIAHPSGCTTVGVDTTPGDDGTAVHVRRVSLYRTTRRLFDGAVHVTEQQP